MAMIYATKKRGFTIFFAMLVGGLALAIGAAIFDLTVRELDLSGTATQSQYAIYAADAGAECALYWDFKCTLADCTSRGASNSVFATSSTFYIAPGGMSGVYCGKNSNGTPQDIIGPAVAGGTWPETSNTSAATTTFTMYFAPQPYCAVVTVSKSGSPSNTTVTSRGYNACPGSPVQSSFSRLERVLQVTY